MTGELSRSGIALVPCPESEVIEADAAITCSTWFLPTVQAMLGLVALPAGWDSRSAAPTRRRTVERALRLLAGILDTQTSPPSVVPTVLGGVQAEWHLGGLDVEIEFFPDERAPYVLLEDLRDRSELEGDLLLTGDRLRSYMPRLRAT